jgi:hypothetical protein
MINTDIRDEEFMSVHKVQVVTQLARVVGGSLRVERLKKR